jgi:hypothetical protein
MSNISKNSSQQDALLAAVKQEMEQPRTAESAHVQDVPGEADSRTGPRSLKEIANNWLAFLRNDDADTSAPASKKK